MQHELKRLREEGNAMKIVTERLIIRTFDESDLPEFEKLLEIEEVPGCDRI
jgi:hypothetical protein